MLLLGVVALARVACARRSEESWHIASWSRRVSHKVRCLQKREGGFYLYHVRKAAGTTLRKKLEVAAKRWRVRLWETEGLKIDSTALALKSVITVVSIRHPVDRILSLYWYEHVGWWDGVKHDHSQMKSMRKWVDEWRDGSEWKSEFTRMNPRNVYVEIENYYVKMLGGGDDLEKAKETLHRFDVLFVCERSTWNNHTALLSQALGGVEDHERAKKNPRLLEADKGARLRLQSTLAPDLSDIISTLTEINLLDLQLYQYALRLDEARVKFSQSMSLRRTTTSSSSLSERENSCDPPPVRQLDSRNGIFRPPGHKH